ncbi:MAG: DMT family transporter [Gemmatimonadetes bacterium]|nr:DMT family transporter [Gemmatimonadota bacterium]
MIAFAGNSLLCRAALGQTGIDAASFTTIRLLSGALALWLIVRAKSGGMSGATGGANHDPTGATTARGSWPSALALFAYAAGFSFAYLSLPAGTGALLLFGAVQVTMIGHGLRAGERLTKLQIIGMMLASGGLIVLLLPGVSAPPVGGSLLMLGAGAAWGVYSLRGRGAGDPTQVTAGNFVRALPFALLLSALLFRDANLAMSGVLYAIASGAVASGIGYAIWYTALPALQAAQAATVQLSVPVIAALGGIVLLGESMTPRLAIAAVAILGGIALVIRRKKSR